MTKNFKKIALETVLTEKQYVKAALHRYLGEDINVGSTVVVVDDTVNGLSGVKGKVKSISDANKGFAEVELDNGTKIQVQTSLLVPV